MQCFLGGVQKDGTKNAIFGEGLAEEPKIKIVFKITRRIRCVKRQAGEISHGELIQTLEEKNLKLNFFNCLLDITLISMNERFKQLNEYSESWSFLYDLKKFPENTELFKFSGDLQLKLTGCFLCDELISLKSFLPDGNNVATF